MNLKGKKNKYICDSCGGEIITVDLDDGVTPAFLRCKISDDCRGTMHSSWYRVKTTRPAQYEWFKPASLKGYSRGMKQHIEMGGLVLRKIEAANGAGRAK